MTEKLICFHCKGEIGQTEPYKKYKVTYHVEGRTTKTVKKQYHENCKVELSDFQ